MFTLVYVPCNDAEQDKDEYFDELAGLKHTVEADNTL